MAAIAPKSSRTIPIINAMTPTTNFSLPAIFFTSYLLSSSYRNSYRYDIDLLRMFVVNNLVAVVDIVGVGTAGADTVEEDIVDRGIVVVDIAGDILGGMVSVARV